MVQHHKPNIFKRISIKLASWIEEYDKTVDESIAFRQGLYCNERKIFLKEIKIMKVLLCIDMLATIILMLIH